MISSNNFDYSPEWKNIKHYIRSKQPNVNLNGWGWCGGSIMHVEKFNEIYDNIYTEKEY
jgi:hypothetical protein